MSEITGLPKPYYDDGKGIVIYCGNCREILPLLEPVDLVLTDPPYGLGDRLQGGTWGKQFGETYQKWDGAALDDLVNIAIEKGTHAVIWGGNYYQLPASRCWLIHDKCLRNMTFADAEMAWTNMDANTRVLSYQVPRGFLGDVRLHPTQKPLKLMTWCLSFFPKAQTVLDPFMGSGTTLLAAKMLGRKAVGIELEERYCRIAVNRLAQDVLDFGGEK